MDALSQVLNSVTLNGALYFNAEFSAPWGASTPDSRELVGTLAAGPAHLVIYHFVLDGAAFVQLASLPPLALEPGDVVVLPHGDEHLVTSDPHSRETRETAAVHRHMMDRELTPLRVGGGGEATRFVCGYMACDPHLSRPILSTLPPVFKVNLRTDRSGQWLESCIQRLVEEAASGALGGAALLARLSEALFVDTLRRYAADLPEQESGWFAAARDPAIGKSLELLHREVDQDWTIATLAKAVGLSRSALAERFTRYLSEPPMAYLTRWRLRLAARALTQTSKGVAEIAREVGYKSEAAFHRAFKRDLGVPPAQYRRGHRTAAPPAQLIA